MEIKIQQEETVTTITLIGRLDTITSGELEKAVAPLLAPQLNLVLECTDLSYVSSSGLRIILMLHKKITASRGTFILRHVCTDIKTVFDMTGFSKLLRIE